MTTGTLKTQNTKLFFVSSGSPNSIQQVACATGITGLGGARDQIEITCLSSVEKEFVGGLGNPGQVTIPINFIPRSASHQALLDLRGSGEDASWMVVFSDQAGAPTAYAVLDGVTHLTSPGATTAEFVAYIADFNIDVATNEIVRATLTLQRSGVVNWNLPAADLA